MQFNYTILKLKGERWVPETLKIELHCAQPDDHICRIIRRRRTFYESDLLEHMAYSGPRGGLFIDVGANIGNHTVYFAKLLADHVLAIEPSANLCAVLRSNLLRNDVANCTVVHAAAGHESSSGRVITPPDHERNWGKTRVESTMAELHADNSTETVAIKSLDRILEDAPSTRRWPVALVKIDVEGMELEVLKGSQNLLAKHRPQLSIELATSFARQEAIEFLRGFGYCAVARFCATPTFHFIDPTIHSQGKTPPGLLRSWHMGRLKRIRTLLKGQQTCA